MRSEQFQMIVIETDCNVHYHNVVSQFVHKKANIKLRFVNFREWAQAKNILWISLFWNTYHLKSMQFRKAETTFCLPLRFFSDIFLSGYFPQASCIKDIFYFIASGNSISEIIFEHSVSLCELYFCVRRLLDE